MGGREGERWGGEGVGRRGDGREEEVGRGWRGEEGRKGGKGGRGEAEKYNA